MLSCDPIRSKSLITKPNNSKLPWPARVISRTNSNNLAHVAACTNNRNSSWRPTHAIGQEQVLRLAFPLRSIRTRELSWHPVAGSFDHRGSADGSRFFGSVPSRVSGTPPIPWQRSRLRLLVLLRRPISRSESLCCPLTISRPQPAIQLPQRVLRRPQRGDGERAMLVRAAMRLRTHPAITLPNVLPSHVLLFHHGLPDVFR